jgi:hypothetical protein
MAYYFLTASKDASVYLQQPNQNTGLDEILEVSKVFYGNIRDISHTLIKFDVGYISASISNNSITMSSAELILKETKSEELPLEYTLYAYPISQSWQMGNGTRFDEISTQGVTWNYREGDSTLDWLPTNVFLNTSTGSYPGDGRGGVWHKTPFAYQSFNYQTADINMDVLSMLRVWMSGSISNEGMIIKHSAEAEDDSLDYGIVKLFSKETNTIYQPKIRIGWDDQKFVTSSLSAIVSENIKIGITNLKKEYKVGTINKLRIFGREMYPIKTFSTTFQYSDIKYLPNTTYYQIKDFNSEDVIIPFSDYSKISCDSTGNYINLNLTNWEANRAYKIEFKVDLNDSTQFFDDEIVFNIIK